MKREFKDLEVGDQFIYENIHYMLVGPSESNEELYLLNLDTGILHYYGTINKNCYEAHHKIRFLGKGSNINTKKLNKLKRTQLFKFSYYDDIYMYSKMEDGAIYYVNIDTGEYIVVGSYDGDKKGNEKVILI